MNLQGVEGVVEQAVGNVFALVHPPGRLSELITTYSSISLSRSLFSGDSRKFIFAQLVSLAFPMIHSRRVLAKGRTVESWAGGRGAMRYSR